MKLKQLFQKTSVKIDVAKMQKQQEDFWNLQRKIFASHIEERKDHLIIDGNVYARCRIIGVPSIGVGYPRDMRINFIDDLLKLSTKGFTVAYSFAIFPVKNKTAVGMVNNARYFNMENQIEYKNKNKGLDSAEFEFLETDLHKVVERLYKGAEKMYSTAFIVLYWAESELKLREIEGHMSAIFSYHRIDSEVPRGEIKKIFFAAMLPPFSEPGATIDCFSNLTAALAATRNPNARSDETGLLMGENFKNNSDMIVDVKALSAQHMVITGASGSGKTVGVLTWLIRSGSILNKRWIFITPKDDTITDYRNVAKSLGDSARILDLGPKGNSTLTLYKCYMIPISPR